MNARPLVVLLLALSAGTVFSAEPSTQPDQLLLREYRPKSIYKIPETRVERARFPIIDVHSHDYARTDEEVDRWVRTMDAVGVEKTVLLTGASGARFDQLKAKYSRYPERFELWCGIDYAGFDQPGFAGKAIAELERCQAAGARGVGELSDKGRGLGATKERLGMHIDDPRMDAILERCGDLKLPVNLHVGEDQWMYEPMDAANDGLMNAWKWRIENAPGVLGHAEVVDTLERAAKKHPRTIFVACHLANCCADLDRFGRMLDACPNVYGDIGARFAELAPVPRAVAAFLSKYPGRILYGTDMHPEPEMYRVTFRLLETADEHIYPPYFNQYHWPLQAMALPDEILRGLYRENALALRIGH